jgi:hypothetical protein
MEKIRIEQVEPRFAQELETPLKDTLRKLGYSIPESFRLRVSLLQANGRKKRSNAGADTWDPQSSERMEFWLEPSTAGRAESPVEVPQRRELLSRSNSTRAEASQTTANVGSQVHPSEVELLRALDRAESTPGWSFVSLKKFRDEILPLEDVPFLRSDVERQNALRYAIDKRLILRGKVQNPKSPQFPVTSIRLNRLLPEVQEVLGLPKKDLEFHPIHIKGEPLSATILRERR